MDRQATTDSAPRPPDILIRRVIPSQAGELTEKDRIGFDASGRQSAAELDIFAASIGRTLDTFSRVLDFGCGCGRVTRWLAPKAANWELHGCDIDQLAITWDQEHLPFGTFVRTEGEPPLPYPDGHFDLVLNHSVFTHLDEGYQDLWLEELHRIVAPHGILVLSVHGEYAFQIAERDVRGGGDDPSEWRNILERKGILFVADDGYVGGDFPDFYHTTFHAPWYVFSHWSKWFDVMSYLPRADLGHQDVVVLQRRPDDQPVPSAIRPATVNDRAPAAAEPVPPRAQMATSFRRIIRTLVEGGSHTGESHGASDNGDSASAEDATSRIPILVRMILNEHGERIRRLEEQAFEMEHHPGNGQGS